MNDEAMERYRSRMRVLDEWIEGDDFLYNTKFVAIIKNLSRRKFRHDYNSVKAGHAFLGFVNESCRRYGEKMFGKHRIPNCFSKQLRAAISIRMRDDFEEKFAAGEYECHKQKYLR